MNIKYVLRKNTIDHNREIMLCENDYLQCKKSKIILDEILAIEEKYNILLNNYTELEKTIFNTLLIGKIHTVSYKDFHEHKLLINTKIVNFLTSARLYIDVSGKHISKILYSKEKDSLKENKATEYDKNICYRFMEALRNYVQHYGIAAHFIEFKKTRDGEFFNFFCIKNTLKKDNRFKKSILEESPENIDLKEYIRSYMDSLGNIHLAARKLTYKTVDVAREKIHSFHLLYFGGQSNCPTASLCIHKIANNTTVDEIPLLLEWDDLRIELQKRHPLPTHYAKMDLRNK